MESVILVWRHTKITPSRKTIFLSAMINQNDVQQAITFIIFIFIFRLGDKLANMLSTHFSHRRRYKEALRCLNHRVIFLLLQKMKIGSKSSENTLILIQF